MASLIECLHRNPDPECLVDRRQRHEYQEIEAGDRTRAWTRPDGSASCTGGRRRSVDRPPRAPIIEGMIKRAAGQIASLYRGSRSYRTVARIVIFLTLVSMAIGDIAALQTGGSAIGDVIFVVVSMALAVVWLGIVLWALAAFWRVRDL
jgi:hypothetical protein